MSHTNSMTKVDRRDAKLAMAHIYVAFIALLLGGLAGLLQVLYALVNLHYQQALVIIKY